MIVADGTVEDNELFSASLSTTNERVILTPQSANITIIDSDSK